MKVAVLGAGAMGSLIGAHLKKGGCDVTLVDPYKEHMDAIAANGLEMTINNKQETVHLKTVYSADAVGPVDLVVLLVKNLQSVEAVKGASALFGGNTYIISLQNGLGTTDALLSLIPADKILKGVMKITSQLLGPGAVKSNVHPNIPVCHVGSVTDNGPANEMAQVFAGVLTAGGLRTEFHHNVEYYVWDKAASNISINALCAVAGVTIGTLLNDPDGAAMQDACLREICEVAAAKGAEADYDKITKYIESSTKVNFAGHPGSTQLDVQAKRRTEIDFLNGTISRYGRELGVPTPVNDVLTALIHIIEKNYA